METGDCFVAGSTMRIGTPGYNAFHFDAAMAQAAALGESQPVKVMMSAYRWASGSPRIGS
ncbi:hypothetical protein XI03_09370 [Bradyrhizobium sp. CCBAU 65884]|nr:hypothetical protein [Bradyrhizobium sp. CCBAU 65884]